MLMDDRQQSGGDGAMSASATGRRHHVVIVGCGFGGLSAAKTLGRAAVDVTVIDRTNHHLVQPLLHQLATGILSEGDIALPIRDVLRRQRNTRVVLGEVVDIDLHARRVTVDTIGLRREIEYDMLIVATGARQSYFGRPEFADDAPGMKTLDDALELRGRIFGAFEMAEGEANPAARRRWLTFLIVGAGPTGVELAGQLAELSRRSLRGNFRRIDPGEARVAPARRRVHDPAGVSRGTSRARCARPARAGSRAPLGHDGHRRRRAGRRYELDQPAGATD